MEGEEGEDFVEDDGEEEFEEEEDEKPKRPDPSRYKN